MNQKYKVMEFTIEELYVNPDNARFINADELPDEIAAIRQLASMHQAHIIRLAQDIALNGLNPNELPIVIPGPNGDNRYLVMDGNRRISSIKLMTQYKEALDKIGIKSKGNRILSNLQCDIKTVICVLYESAEQVNDLLEKLHTSKPGISQVKWDPLAQDRHQYRSGHITKRLAVIEMLRISKHTSPQAKAFLDQGNWISMLDRFVRTDSALFFGISFDDENNIILYLDEYEVVKGLSQLVVDIMSYRASEIAQTKELRQDYFKNIFPIDKKPNIEKINNPAIIFNVESKHFKVSNISNNEYINIASKVNSNNKDSEINQLNTNEIEKSDQKETLVPTKTSSNTHSQGISDLGLNKTKKDGNSQVDNIGIKSTFERTTLIPADEVIHIKNQRTRDLFEELKLVNIGKYKNIVSIAFRSLIEFSINCFLEVKKSNFAYNEQVTFFKKLEKVLGILESKYTKSRLEEEMPLIYISMDSYKEGKIDLNSIPLLHLLIHSHNFHPTEKDLKNLYNNYSPLLKRIWQEI